MQPADRTITCSADVCIVRAVKVKTEAGEQTFEEHPRRTAKVLKKLPKVERVAYR